MANHRELGPKCQVRNPRRIDDGTLCRSKTQRPPPTGLNSIAPGRSDGGPYRRYRVRQGDTLWEIARVQCDDPTLWPRIAKINHLRNPDFLLVGITLNLPIVNSLSEHPDTHPQTKESPPRPPIVAPRRTEPASEVYSQTELLKPFRPVLYPPYKYELDHMPSVTVEVPGAEITLSLKGSVTLQDTRVVDNLTFTKEGMELEYKREVDLKFSRLTTKAQVKYDAEKKTVELSCGLTSAVVVNGEVWWTTSFEVTPEGFKFTYKPREVTGKSGPYLIKGEMGYEMLVKPKRPPSTPVPEPVPIPIQQTGKWVAIGLITVAGVIIVVDIVKDVGTAGVGLAESPLSFAAAAALFDRGMAAFAP